MNNVLMDSHLAYRRARFSTRLPTDRVFTKSHFWIAVEADGVLRIGYTKFATRMLGEIVEFDFEVKPDNAIETGDVIGWLEGFKAVSDIYAPASGRFMGPNPALDEAIGAIDSEPYDAGWLFRVAGEVPDDGFGVTEYAGFLDETIGRMMGGSP